MKIESRYTIEKRSVEFMINHYEQNCLRYLDYSYVCHMKLEDLEMLYSYDEGMVEMYKEKLSLLEQITWN